MKKMKEGSAREEKMESKKKEASEQRKMKKGLKGIMKKVGKRKAPKMFMKKK
jgi:hypothetical protein